MKEYKGIYYSDDNEKKFFEGGAHFKYIKLYQRLEQLASEQKLKEKEIYINKNNKLKNILNNNNMNYLDNISQKNKSRNIPAYLNNMTSTSITNYNKNKSHNNNALTENKKNGDYNDSSMKNKTNYHRTYIIIQNNKKDNSNKNIKSLGIINQKKIIISRNKPPSIILKGRPKTIFKEGGIQNSVFFRKNNLISNLIEQEKHNKNILTDTLNKRSFPNINNINNRYKLKGIKTNESYLVNKSGNKTERNKGGQSEKWNKSQKSISRIKIRLNSTNIKNPKIKIKKKKFIINERKKINERTKSNLTNFVYRNIIERFNYKKEIDNENCNKKESNNKKLNKKRCKNNPNKILIFPNENASASKTKSKNNLNNQIKKIVSKPNITQNLNKKMSSNLCQLPFNEKSRNINTQINDINDSFVLKSNQNIKRRNNVIMNTSRNGNDEKFKTSFKIKQNNKVIQQKNIINKYSQNINKKINKNQIISCSNINNYKKNINYKYVIDNFRINKEKILQNINNNNLSDLRNKTLNINIINNTCIYIKPKNSKYFNINQSRNERMKNSTMHINYTQRPIMKKKKPIIKLIK